MESLLEYIIKNYRKILGAVTGFIIGYFLITRGILLTLVLIICVIAGYIIGGKTENFNLRTWLIKVLSKGDE